ncbi:MAG: zinc-dependent alcohol dehydrogenase [Terriglobia bacterium]
MKALVYTATRKLEWIDWPRPKPGAGEALVRVSAVGVCGSDVHGWLGKSRGRVPPLVLGHEIAGVVEEIHGDRRVRAREAVAIYPVTGCGECRYCRDDRDRLCASRQILGMHAPGGLAEFLKAPAANLYPLPESMDGVAGALVEPLANALHFVEYARRDTGAIAILGAGAIGLLMLQVARQLSVEGVRLFPRIAVAEVNPRRAALARTRGADLAVDPRAPGALAELQSFFGKDGCSAALDAAGFAASRRLAIQLVAPGGLVGLAGMGEAETAVDCVDLIRREIRFAGIYGYGRDHFRRAIDWLAGGRIEYKSWISEAQLADGQRVFEDLAQPDTRQVKVVLRP